MGHEYSPETALVVVDVQNDFADPGGSLYVDGGQQVVAEANREIERARQAGALVVYSQDWHPSQTPHFADFGGTWPRHCVAGTPGAELHPELDVDGPVVRKGVDGEDGYSAFSVRDPETGEQGETALDRILREHGVTSVVIIGLALDVCVKDTALDAVARGYRTSLVLDATRPVDLTPGDGERAVDELRAAGVDVR
jgi:nicotinamidase/pyrazinamidase